MLTSAGLPSLDTLLADTSDDAVPSDPLRFVGNPNSERVVRTGFAHADVSLSNVVSDRLRPPSVLLPTNVEQRRRILLQHASPELAASSSSPPIRRNPAYMSDSDSDFAPLTPSSPVGHSAADAAAHSASGARTPETPRRRLERTPPGTPGAPPAFSAAVDLAERHLESELSNAEMLAQLPPQHQRTSSEEYVASLLQPRRFGGLQPARTRDSEPPLSTAQMQALHRRTLSGDYVASLLAQSGVDLQPARTRDSEPAAAAASSSAASGSSESPMVVDDADSGDEEGESALQRVLQQSFNEQFLPTAAPAAAAAASNAAAAASSRASEAAAAVASSIGASMARTAAAAAASRESAAAADDSDEDEDLDPDGPVQWSNVVNVSEERKSKLSCVVGMCSNVPLNGPHMHHKCRHYLCAPCFYGLTSSSSNWAHIKCPGCRQTIASSEPSEVRNDAMADLKARCIYHRSGCTVVTTLENGGKHEKAHRQRCSFRPMPCKFCKAEFTAKKLDTHQAQCPQRKVNCDLCSKEMAASDLPSHRTSPLGPAYCQSHNFCPNRCFAKDCKVQPTAEVLDRLRPMRDSDLRVSGALERILSGFKTPTVKVTYEKPMESSGAAAAEKKVLPPPRLAVITASRLSSHLADICPCRLVDCSFPGCTDSIPHSHGGAAAAAANPKKRKFVAHELPAHLNPDNKKAKDAHMLAMAARIRELTELLVAAPPRSRVLIQSYNLCISTSRLLNNDSHLSEIRSNVESQNFISGSVKVSGIYLVAGQLTVKFSTPRVGMPTAFEAVITIANRRNRALNRDEFVMDARRACDVSSSDKLSLWLSQAMRTALDAMGGEPSILINIKVELFQ